MKTLYLLFALALMYFGWSYSSWEVSAGYGDESARPMFPSELRTVEGLPR